MFSLSQLVAVSSLLVEEANPCCGVPWPTDECIVKVVLETPIDIISSVLSATENVNVQLYRRWLSKDLKWLVDRFGELLWTMDDIWWHRVEERLALKEYRVRARVKLAVAIIGDEFGDTLIEIQDRFGACQFVHVLDLKFCIPGKYRIKEMPASLKFIVPFGYLETCDENGFTTAVNYCWVVNMA